MQIGGGSHTQAAGHHSVEALVCSSLFLVPWRQRGKEVTPKRLPTSLWGRWVDSYSFYYNKRETTLTTKMTNFGNTTIDTQEDISQTDLSLYLCGACHTPVNDDHEAVLCESCDTWFHICCQGIPSNEYSRLNCSSVIWACLNLYRSLPYQFRPLSN